MTYPQLNEVTAALKAAKVEKVRRIKDWAGKGFRRCMIEGIIRCDKKATAAQREELFMSTFEPLVEKYHIERNKDGQLYGWSYVRGDAYIALNIIVHCALPL